MSAAAAQAFFKVQEPLVSIQAMLVAGVGGVLPTEMATGMTAALESAGGGYPGTPPTQALGFWTSGPYTGPGSTPAGRKYFMPPDLT